jgi:micrococcal nuclease
MPAQSPPPPPVARPVVLKGPCHVIDGDTIVIDRQRIRLAGIDAPELDHPYGHKSKWALVRVCKGKVVTAQVTGELSYGRYVAACTLPDGTDLAAELVRAGLAVDWPKYSGGRYRHLEPPGIRKRLWRCDARQRGRMPPQDFGARAR